MQLKDRIRATLRKEFPEEKAWKGFIYWWLAANGYEYSDHQALVSFVDGASDGGIDAVAWPLEAQSRKEVLVVQSKFFGQAPTSKDLERFQEAIDAFEGPMEEFQGWLDGCREQLHGLYRRLREERRRHRYVLIAPCRFDAWERRDLREKGIEVHDAEVLRSLERNYEEGRTPRVDEIRFAHVSPAKQVAAADGTKVWVFTVPARELGLAYERHGDVLFAGNVRYALSGQTAQRVRTGMLDTLQNAPHEFVFSHNGITVSGSAFKRSNGTVTLRCASIVNGAQTVSYLGKPGVLKQLGHNPARVIVKFVQVNDPDLLNDIESKVAFRSNNQNKVDPSDLMIELPSLVSLQRYFRRQGVHLERKKGEQKLRYGEFGIPKERLAQVLSAVESSEGAVKGKRKQELFMDSAQRLFSDYDASEDARAAALAWARVDGVFRNSIGWLANNKRRKRAQLAELAALRVFYRVLQRTGLKSGFLRAMARWDSERQCLEPFIENSCKAIISALLRCSAADKKNEPAFYKAIGSVKPAVASATYWSRKKVRRYYKWYFGG